MNLNIFNKFRLKTAILFLFFGFGVLFALGAQNANAATLSLSPSTGTFEVGSTFNVNIILNTEGQTVNAITADLRFPPDALQVVSPASGKSVIGIWTVPPRYDNAAGLLELEGGIPGGLNTSSGLISTMTFRVKKPGTAFVQFLDSSEVYLHDGQGTPALSQT